MTGLPHGLTAPLHIDRPPPYGLMAIALLLLVIRRKRSAEKTIPPVLSTPQTGDIGTLIEELRRRHRRLSDFRLACHELAAELRTYYDRKMRRSISTLTTREMVGRLGDTAVTRLFQLLAELQFSRKSPSRNDFEGACDVALEVPNASSRGDTE